MTTAIKICAEALTRLGATPIQSFEEETDLAVICENIYFTKVKHILSLFPWRFSFKYAQLSRLVDAPLLKWAYQYTLPADRVQSGFPEVYSENRVDALPTNDYELVGDVLMTNLPEVYVKYQYRVNEDFWPPYFVELIINVMLCELAYPVTENASLKSELFLETYGLPSEGGQGGLFNNAMNLDSRDNPTLVLSGNTLIDARY